MQCRQSRCIHQTFGSRIRAPCRRPQESHTRLEGATAMIIELGKVAEKTKGTDVGLKLDSNVGAKVHRYNTFY